MSSTKIDELITELYWFEHRRKDAINSGMAMLLGVVSALIGVCGYYLLNWSWTLASASNYLFLLGLLGGAIVLAGATRRFLWALQGGYSYVTEAEAIDEKLTEYRDYYEDDSQAETRLLADLRSQLINASSVNHRTNQKRIFLRAQAIRRLTASTVILAITSIPFALSKPKAPHDPVSRERITEPAAQERITGPAARPETGAEAPRQTGPLQREHGGASAGAARSSED